MADLARKPDDPAAEPENKGDHSWQSLRKIEGEGGGDSIPRGQLRSVPYSGKGNADSEAGGWKPKVIDGDGKSSPRTKEHLRDAEEAFAKDQVASPSHTQEQFGITPESTSHAEASFWKGGKSKDKSWRGRFRNRRKMVFGVGLSGLVMVLLAIAIFNLLNIFKLDGIISNIDSRAFARLSGVQDRRSIDWMEAYMRMRLADIGDRPNLDKGTDSENQFFRSEKCQISPVCAWYKVLRGSQFERDVFEKQGFKFVSVRDDQGRIRPGKILLNDRALLTLEVPQADWDGLANGNVEAIRRYNTLVDLEKFDNDRDARRAIRIAVDNDARFNSAFKRYIVRKTIQRMTGVRDWRFFEDRRNKFDEKKISMRNKLIVATIPDTVRAGKFVHCLFGISECTFQRDSSAPSNRATIGLNERPLEGRPTKEVDEEGRPIIDEGTGKPKTVDLGPAANALKTIAKSAIPVLNAVDIVSLLDSLVKVHEAIQDNKLSKGVAVARGVQAMKVYQTLGTSRDQIKAGEVQAAEVNALMGILSTVASSEGWQEVIEGKGSASQLTNNKESSEYCSEKYQAELEKDLARANKEFSYLCPDQQIGGGNNAAKLEDSYNKTLGGALDPILKAYTGVRDLPLIGGIADFATRIFEKVSNAVVGAALKIFGLDDNINSLMERLGIRMAGFMGAGPIKGCSGAAGVCANWAIQGAAFTQESTLRDIGASQTTPESAATVRLAFKEYQQGQAEQMSLSDRYLSLSNYKSLASTSLFALSQQNFSSMAKFLDVRSALNSFASALSGPFGRKAQAANDNPYRPADFAGIDTYDFPQQCYDLDPISATPASGTNIQVILPGKVPENELTWDLVTNSEAWYDYIYEKIGDVEGADETAVKVYNCHLLDASISGSLGFLYGYDNGSGLREQGPAASSEQPVPSSGSRVIGNPGENSDNVACAAGTKDLGIVTTRYTGRYKTSAGSLVIRLCQIPSIAGNGDSPSGANLAGGATVSSRVSGAWMALGQAAKQAGINLTSNSSFRLEDSCSGMGDGTACALPGTSPHQMGVAIDLAQMNVRGTSITSCSGRAREENNPIWQWLYKNADKYGIEQYTFESWHWDALPIDSRCGFGQ